MKDKTKIILGIGLIIISLMILILTGMFEPSCILEPSWKGVSCA